MDSDSDFYLSYSCPSVYKVNLTSLKDMLQNYTDIVGGVASSGLEASFVEYVTSIVEPVGWKAVWRATNNTSPLDTEYDFIAEVTNVSLQALEADIFVKSIIVDDGITHDVNKLKEKINVENVRTVPLIELYVVSEDDYEIQFEETAIAIEYVRIFYKHIYRPWDSEEETVYTEEILKSRVQLYFDMKNNILPKTMISKIKTILKEGARIVKELKLLYSEMHVSDSESEINEDDLMHSLTLRKKLEKLQAKMEMLENPVIRTFVTKKYTPSRSLKKQPKSAPVTYVVAKEFTKEIVETVLSLESTSVLEFEHSPENAFKHSTKGDKIFIFPGIYECDNLGWLECDISVEGIGVAADIILEATGNSDVLLNCLAEKIRIQNISLVGKSGLLSPIVVHHGETHLENCVIDSNGAKIGILLLEGVEASLENCTVANAMEDGVQMRSLSSFTCNSSKILLSKRHGLQIDAECAMSPNSFTKIVITDSQINDNGGYGIFLNNVPISEISLQRPPGDFSVLGLFPWLKYQIEDIVMANNGEIGVGISSTCKRQNQIMSESSFLVPSNLSLTDDLNHSALSDLLNEINISNDTVEPRLSI